VEGVVGLSFAVRTDALALPTRICRPDGSCGLQLALFTLLEENDKYSASINVDLEYRDSD